ncbi:Gfo/Idh/MocA family protein [Acrocarpospora catenulata]|uniref:Gfo/Idh/MocA family protein n=1 Tax=Acrocarpospora catenulata TaxID=2836182 RepID=UPI001BDAC74A|nr:Gfo/Idh/MocA family oxidoreductase [Acrocarpospora catenulata]
MTPIPARIGVIGAGRIVRTGHLPAYISGGVPVAAICARTRASAEQAARALPGVRIHDSAVELAADPDVEIIDVATRPHGRLDLVRALLPYGKPLLLQKPVAYSLDEARAIADEAARAGVPVAVNHNLRWAPAQRLLLDWARGGGLGRLAHLAHVHHFNEDEVTWYTDHPGYLFLDHGLHYLDLARRLAGADPVAVTARAGVLPGQAARCPLTYTIMLAFDSPLVATLSMYDRTRTPHAWASAWYVNGDQADAQATYSTATLHTAAGPQTHTPPGEWVPDGILGAYTAFTQALAAGTVPEHDITDHLRSLAVASAAAASAARDGEWITVPETGPRAQAAAHGSSR